MIQRTLPIVVAGIVGVFMAVQFFVPHPAMRHGYNLVLDCKQVVFGFTLMLGVFSLLRFHGRKVARRTPDRIYSLVVIASCAASILAAVIAGTERGPYMWLYDRVQAPMQATLFSLLAYFVASASYRAFRARSVHATLLLLAGSIVMLGRVPTGDLLAVDLGGHRLSLASLADWILGTPNLAAKRGIMIGVGLGMISTSLRIILGIERGYLGQSSSPGGGGGGGR
jgi:hypothetical protein